MYQMQERRARDSGSNSVDRFGTCRRKREICFSHATFKLFIPRLNSFAIAHPTAKFETGSQFKMDQFVCPGG